VRGSFGKFLIVFGETAAMWFEIRLVSGELLRVLLVGLSRLVCVDDDLIEDLEVKHEKA